MRTKQKDIYNEVFAHRGFHIKYPENTLESFNQAAQQNFAIEIDIRYLKDGNIICFHDRYMKRLLGIPGKVTRKTLDKIRKYNVLSTEYKVPTLKEVLKEINGKVSILIEPKGYMTKEYKETLINILNEYSGKVYFHCKNFLTYTKLKKVFGKKVYYVLNPFRKRFEFVKGKDYKKVSFIPAIDDIVVEAEDRAETVIRKIYKTFNKHTTRVDENHWLLRYNGKRYQIQHRAIFDTTVIEHSKEAFEKCSSNKKVIELDVAIHNGKLVCYHDDSISNKLGQNISIASKNNIDTAILFKEALEVINGRVPIIIDIKDFNIMNRSLEINIMKELENYSGEFSVQSFNPLVNIFFMRMYPDAIRGQIGHSLNGLKLMRRPLLAIVNFCLFYISKPDYIVYDLDNYVYLLSKFNNILGLPVIGYSATKLLDITMFEEFFDNIIVEGIIDFKGLDKKT